MTRLIQWITPANCEALETAINTIQQSKCSRTPQLVFNIISTATTYIWEKLSFLHFVVEVPERGWDVMGHGTPALSAAHSNSGSVSAAAAAVLWSFYR